MSILKCGECRVKMVYTKLDESKGELEYDSGKSMSKIKIKSDSPVKTNLKKEVELA